MARKKLSSFECVEKRANCYRQLLGYVEAFTLADAIEKAKIKYPGLFDALYVYPF